MHNKKNIKLYQNRLLLQHKLFFIEENGSDQTHRSMSTRINPMDIHMLFFFNINDTKAMAFLHKKKLIISEIYRVYEFYLFLK